MPAPRVAAAADAVAPPAAAALQRPDIPLRRAAGRKCPYLAAEATSTVPRITAVGRIRSTAMGGIRTMATAGIRTTAMAATRTTAIRTTAMATGIRTTAIPASASGSAGAMVMAIRPTPLPTLPTDT